MEGPETLNEKEIVSDSARNDKPNDTRFIKLGSCSGVRESSTDVLDTDGLQNVPAHCNED